MPPYTGEYFFLSQYVTDPFGVPKPAHFAAENSPQGRTRRRRFYPARLTRFRRPDSRFRGNERMSLTPPQNRSPARKPAVRGDERGSLCSAMPLDFLVSALVTLLVVVDPIGLVPSYLAVTQDLPKRAKRRVATRAAV